MSWHEKEPGWRRRLKRKRSTVGLGATKGQPEERVLAGGGDGGNGGLADLDVAEGALEDAQVGEFLVVDGGQLLAQHFEAFAQVGAPVLLQLVVHLARARPAATKKNKEKRQQNQRAFPFVRKSRLKTR